MFFSLCSSNFSSCCPDPAAPNKASSRALGWLRARRAWAGHSGGLQLPPATPRVGGNSAFPCHPSPTFPGLVQDPPVPLSCPSVLSHRGLDQSVPPAAAQLHLPAAPGGNHLPPEQAGAPEGPGGCPGAGSEPPAPAGEGPGGCPGWGGQPHLSQSLQSSIHTSSSQLHIPVHGGSPARGGCTGDLVFAEHPEVGTELGGAGSSAGRVCARGGAISGALLGKGIARGDKGQV